jgi:hypothetical protein
MGKRNKLVTCRYCQVFRKSPVLNDREGVRVCAVGGDVFQKTPACNSFQMREGFWCDKRMNHLDVIICLAAQDKRLGKHCKPTCKQGMAIVACQQFNPPFIPLRRRKG